VISDGAADVVEDDVGGKMATGASGKDDEEDSGKAEDDDAVTGVET